MINTLIKILKWPVALIMVWMLPGAVQLVWKFITAQQFVNHVPPPPVLGFVGYLLLWFLLFRRQFAGAYVSTLEHECTHGLFAILTGHSVKAIRVTARSGGHIVYDGGSGNWLITIAPYFFPTITLLLLAVRLILGGNYWLELGIGASIAFHMTSTYLETHAAQDDLKNVGWVFACCFLPSANILTYTLIASYLQSGWGGVKEDLEFLHAYAAASASAAWPHIHSLIVRMTQ